MFCIVTDCFFIEPSTFDRMKRFSVFLWLDRSPVVTAETLSHEVNSLCLTLFHLLNSCTVIFIDPKLRSQSNTNHLFPPDLNYICLIVDVVSVMAGPIHSSHNILKTWLECCWSEPTSVCVCRDEIHQLSVECTTKRLIAIFLWDGWWLDIAMRGQ